MSYNSIAWLPLAAGLTAIGLILSYFTWRRRGLRSALRGVAWSLLPVAAYLTGSIEMFWKIGAAIGKFAEGFVFSAERWAGIGVAALAVVLYLAAGGRERRKAARLARREARAARRREAAGGAGGAGAAGDTEAAAAPASLAAADGTKPAPTARLPQRVPSGARKPAKAGKTTAPDGDDMKDIEEILRNRGI